jgi:hypothetical protein
MLSSKQREKRKERREEREERREKREERREKREERREKERENVIDYRKRGHIHTHTQRQKTHREAERLTAIETDKSSVPLTIESEEIKRSSSHR